MIQKITVKGLRVDFDSDKKNSLYSHLPKNVHDYSTHFFIAELSCTYNMYAVYENKHVTYENKNKCNFF